MIYTPGDNGWTDCHRAAAGGFDPLERLAHIRDTYFTTPGESFGSETVELEHQGEEGYPENVRYRMGDLAIVAAHIVGSNNNFQIRDMAAVEEFMARDAASIAWMRDSFAAHADAAAVILAIHADMFWGGFDGQDEDRPGHSGFARFGPALQEAAGAFSKPVLLVHGDSHVLDVFRPFLQTGPILTAQQVFGAAEMHAVEVMVDTSLPSPFAVRPLLNPALIAGG